MRRAGAALVPWAVLVALACACFARLITEPTALILDGRRPSVDHANRGDPRPVGNDVTFVFLPHHLQVARSLRETGHLPAWDPSGFGGRPMIGNPQGGLFYPPVWPAWCVPAPATLGWLTVAHLLWGGAGTYLLARRQGLDRSPATVAAGLFQASPYLLAQTFEGHVPHVWSVSWFPWAFWAHLEGRAGRARGFLALPLILALCALAGHPQEWYLLVLALSAWVAVDALVLAIRGKLRAALRYLGGWIGALGMGLGLAAVELVTVVELFPWTARGAPADPGASLPRNYVVGVWSLLQLLSPRALGGPADFSGPDNYWETVVSFGLVPLLLIAVGAGAILRKRSGAGVPRPAVGWVALAVGSLWFATGPSLGLYTACYRIVPGMSLFRVPARSLFLTTLAASVLAGFGLQALSVRWRDPASWRRFATRLVGIGGLGIGLLGLLILAAPPSKNAERLGQAVGRIVEDPVFGFAVAVLAATAVSGGLLRERLRRFPIPSIVGALALVELGLQGYALLQVTPAAEVLAPDPVSRAILGLPSPDPSGAPVRLRARDSFYLDLQAIRHGLEKTNVNDVFQLGHAAALYEQLYALASSRNPLTRVSFHAAPADEQRRIRQAVCDRMAVAYLVSDRFEDDPGWRVAASGTTTGGRPFVIQHNPTALPRAYVVPRAQIAPDDPAAILRRLPDSDPRQAVLMTADPLASIPPGPRQAFTPARWLGRDPDHPVLEVTTSAPGLLVIADTWMPGWSARVDGRAGAVLRGNHAQQVVPLETPGPHRIELAYRPPGLVLGTAVTAMSGSLWLALAVVAASRRLRQGPRSRWPERPHRPHLAADEPRPTLETITQ